MLVGNTFPFSLIRRECRVVPMELEDVRRGMQAPSSEFVSFWGHENTARAASDAIGVEIPVNRVSLTLTADNLPSVDGVNGHGHVLVVSADIPTANRRATGDNREYEPSEIEGWSCLLISFQ